MYLIYVKRIFDINNLSNKTLNQNIPTNEADDVCLGKCVLVYVLKINVLIPNYLYKN